MTTTIVKATRGYTTISDGFSNPSTGQSTDLDVTESDYAHFEVSWSLPFVPTTLVFTPLASTGTSAGVPYPYECSGDLSASGASINGALQQVGSGLVTLKNVPRTVALSFSTVGGGNGSISIVSLAKGK